MLAISGAHLTVPFHNGMNAPMKKIPVLSLERLREVLEYDPKTGLFRWKITLSSRAPAGRPAGFHMKNGYIGIAIDNVDYYAHRLAWFTTYERWPFQVDHINCQKSDNRISNLRETNFVGSSVNRPRRKDNTSGATGIHFDKSRQKWLVNVGHKFHGRFDSKDEAVVHRKKMAALTYGEFCHKT